MSFIPVRFRRTLLTGAVVLVAAACGGANSDAGPAAAEGSAAPANSVEKVGEGALSDMALGDKDAKVTVIEYASVTCPHCATFHEDIFPEIKEDYIDTGKVRFIFREFPTSPANLSIAGSMLARCAADKRGDNAYFLVLDTLFKNQGNPYQENKGWIYGDAPREELLKIAAQAGMSAEDFDACMQRQELLDFLNANIKEGSEKYGISSTPSFVVNGQTRHFNTAEEMSKALDEALAKAEAPAGE
jgi:protein-disulfide isomerase